jgi:DTW domain-containing protein YfiP
LDEPCARALRAELRVKDKNERFAALSGATGRDEPRAVAIDEAEAVLEADLPDRERGEAAVDREPRPAAVDRERGEAPIDPLPRDCYRCWKPRVTCVCGSLSPVDNRTEVFVLQHPREHQHPIGTARFAELGLRRSRVEVAWNASAREDEPPAWLEPDTALLYPAEHARDVRELRPDERPRRLLVLDGTWHTARTLYRDKRWLRALPHLRVQPEAPGRYRIRREPQADYLSTIEAIVEALRVLEPETRGLSGLIEAFDAMIDAQIAYTTNRSGQRRQRLGLRPRAQRRLPRDLVDRFEDLIVVYGEASRRSIEPREFVYFAACKPSSGALGKWIMHPVGGLPDRQHLEHLGLCEADFVGALSRQQFLESWAEFVRGGGPTPLLAAWNQSTLDLLAALSGTAPARLALKGAYRAGHGRDAQSLAAVVAQHALALAPNDLRGRSSERLAGAVAVLKFLHASAWSGR